MTKVCCILERIGSYANHEERSIGSSERHIMVINFVEICNLEWVLEAQVLTFNARFCGGRFVEF